jgi:hypothetical protein
MAWRRWLVQVHLQHHGICIQGTDAALAQIAIQLTNPDAVAHRSSKHRTDVIRPTIHKTNPPFIQPIGTVENNDVHGWISGINSTPSPTDPSVQHNHPHGQQSSAVFEHPGDQLLLAARLKLSVGSTQRRRIVLEPAAIKEIQDPINIEITISHVLPEALA